MLFLQENERREVKDLSGIWEFRVDKNNEGLKEEWFAEKLENSILMPVPCSYNDITQDASIREHIGDVWYQRSFFVPVSWHGKRVVIRVGSASHKATIWINGQEAASHKGGFLPFEAEISDRVCYGRENNVTIRVNNVLDWTTLPPGEVKTYDDEKHPKGYRTQDYFHDFYNYSGIHRPVKLYSTSRTYVEDVTVVTDIDQSKGVINYGVHIAGEHSSVRVSLLDKELCIGEASDTKGKFIIEDAHFWEPGNAYLYRLKIEPLDAEGNAVDCYYQNVGIRTVKVSGKEFLINGKPFYFKGFGKHEDSDILGKGLSDAVNIKDFNLLKWIGANSFRTSHYPYAEEIMELADREGFVVIDEVPAVGFCFWDDSKKVFCEERASHAILEHHLQVLGELVRRDKNHPCVVMWSVANEAATHEEGSVPYFKAVAEETRKLDPTRPITLVQTSTPERCKVAQMFDVVCVNRYYSWYEDPGHLELVEFQVEKELRGWHERFKQPVIMTEYGADAIAGFHQDPPTMFTEEYQWEVLNHYHNVFDKLDFVIGEHVWNFADFATKQGTVRVNGNKKGIFTRQRQPKAAARLLKERWQHK